MRTNGFQTPFNGMQIATWVLLPVLVVQFLMCVTPVLPKVFSIPLTISYVLVAIAATYYGYITTKTDSIDYLLHQHLYGSPSPNAPNPVDNDSNEIVHEENPSSDATKYCWVCQTNVHQESMHCKYCDKCVETFDHHCMWLNTCVGAANYQSFFKTVVCTFFFTLVHVASLTLYVALYFTDNVTVRRLSRKWFSAEQPIVILGINIGFLIWTTSIAFMVLQLLVFHLGLRREKITTYQYIMRDSQRKRDKMILGQKVRQRRVEELEKAGNSMEALLLKMGGTACCTPCDPVRKLVLQEAEQADANEDNDSRNSLSFRDDHTDNGGDDEDETAPQRSTAKKGSNASTSLGNGDMGGSFGTSNESSRGGKVSKPASNSDVTSNGMGSMASATYCAIEKDAGENRDNDNNEGETEHKESSSPSSNSKPIFIKVEKNGATDDNDGIFQAFEPRKRRNTDVTPATSESGAEVEEDPLLLSADGAHIISAH